MNRLKTTRACRAVRSSRLLAFGVLALPGFDGASAATKTWDAGGGDLLWSTANNWNSNGTPAAGDTIVFASSFASGTAINLNGNRTIADLSITSTTDFSLNNNTLTISSGDITRSAAFGTTTINSGIALGGNAGWNISGTLIANGIVSGSRTLTKSGTGTLTLANANTYTGDTTVSAGILKILNAAALGATSGNTIVDANGELQLQGGITVASGEALSLTGTGTGAVGSAALRNISGNNAWTDTITLQNVTGVVRINSDSDTLTLGSINETGTRNKDLAIGGAGNVTVSGTITGGGGDLSLTKDGTGMLTLASANTYTGTSTVSAGVLKLANASALPGGIGSSGGTANLIINGGVIGLAANDFQRGLGTGSSQVRFAGSGGFAGYAADRNVNLGGAGVPSTVTWGSGSFVPSGSSLILGAADADKTVTFQNSIALNGAVRTVQVNDGAAAVDAVLSGVLSGTGASGLIKTGAGALTLSGASTYTGLTEVQAGTLALGAGNVLANSSTLRVSGGTLSLGANSDTVAGVQLTGGGITGSGGVLASTTAYDLQAGSVSAILGGAVDVKKTTAGTVFLSGNNSYTGVTTFGAGIVNVANLTNYGVAGSLGQRAVDTNPPVSNVGLRFMGGTLQYTGSTAQSTDRDIRVGNAGATLDASGSNPAATMSFAKSGPNVDIWDTDGARTLTLTGSNTGDNIFAINWQERAAGRSSIVKSGSGTWVLTNPNNSAAQTDAYNTFGGYGGGTTISGGTLGFFENAIGGGVVDFTGDATLRWESGNTQDISTGSGAGAARSLRIGDGVTATFHTNGNDVSLSNAFDVGLLKTGAIVKTGAGKLTLSAANIYTGTTTVSGGILAIDGTQVDATGNLSVSGSTSRLEGSGTVGANTTTISSGGTLVAGLSFDGTGVSSDLEFAPTSIFEWDVSLTGAYSLSDVEGNLSGSGAVFRILLNDFGDDFWNSDRTWSLADIFAPASVSPGGTFASIFTSLDTSEPSLDGARGFAISGNNLTWTAIPEPGSALIGLLLAGGLLSRRRR